MACEGPRTVHTVGHSTRSLDTFLALLRAHWIDVVVDVRRWPTSRRFPHFCKESLQGSLASEGIRYVGCPDLGGYRRPRLESPNLGWRVGAFRAYADFMLTSEFHRKIGELEVLAGRARLALMCAEAVPWRCHRQLLADAFLVRNWEVRHIGDRRCALHRLTPFAQVEGTRIVYRATPTSEGCPGTRLG